MRPESNCWELPGPDINAQMFGCQAVPTCRLETIEFSFRVRKTLLAADSPPRVGWRRSGERRTGVGEEKRRCHPSRMAASGTQHSLSARHGPRGRKTGGFHAGSSGTWIATALERGPAATVENRIGRSKQTKANQFYWPAAQTPQGRDLTPSPVAFR